MAHSWPCGRNLNVKDAAMCDEDRAGSARLEQPAEPGAGSAEEFARSEDPRCRDGAKACTGCLMRGGCLMPDGPSYVAAAFDGVMQTPKT